MNQANKMNNLFQIAQIGPKDNYLKRILVGSIVLAKQADYMIGNVNQYSMLTDECEPMFLYYIYIYVELYS